MKLKLHCTIISLLSIFLSSTVNAQVARLFWVQSSGTPSNDQYGSSNLDGSNQLLIASGNSATTFTNPAAVAVDPATGESFVGDGNFTTSTGISRYSAANVFQSTVVAGSANYSFNGIQVVGSKLYWVQSSSTAANDQLCSANLDGSGVTVLVSGNSAATFTNPQCLFVDSANNVIYVGDGAVTGSTGISRFTLTGSFLNTIVAGSSSVSYNAIQVVGSRIYWVQSSSTAANDQLCSANLDGSGLTVLASGNSATTFIQPQSIFVDSLNSIIYIGDGAATGSTGISRFTLDGYFLNTIAPGSATTSFNALAAYIPFRTGPVPASLCSGAQFSVAYSSNITFSPGNVFSAQLSNSTGSFSSPVNIGSLTATASSVTVTIPAATPTGSLYRIRVVASSPATTSADNGTNISITNTTPSGTTGYLSDATSIKSITLTTGVSSYFADASCRSIASVRPTGNVMGATIVKVTVQNSALTVAGQPYLRRYYDITPATNATTATATITLYYTQADFDNYNAAQPNALIKLPANTTTPELAKRANLLITQQHGTSSTGALNTFTGWSGSNPNVTIDPADTNIIWNNSESRWEVTFNVTGFSGFFAYTAMPAIPLSLTLSSFVATAEGAGNRISWTAINDAPATGFSVERSRDGKDFLLIGKVNSKAGYAAYSFYDKDPLRGNSYYRLAINNASGEANYSNVITVSRNEAAGGIVLSPVPATGTLSISNTNVLLMGSDAVIYNLEGRKVLSIVLQAQQEIDTTQWPTGIYLLRLANGSVHRIAKL